MAELSPRQGSGSLTSITCVDALVIIPGERSTLDSSELLDAILLVAPPG
jgi:hypothetical protein